MLHSHSAWIVRFERDSQESWLALQTLSLLWGDMLGNDLKYGDAFCLFVLGQKQNKTSIYFLIFILYNILNAPTAGNKNHKKFTFGLFLEDMTALK